MKEKKVEEKKQTGGFMKTEVITADIKAEVQQALTLKSPITKIKNSEDAQVVGEFLKNVKSKYKTLDERLKSITDPLNLALKNARNLFKPAFDFLTEQEYTAKKLLAEYNEAIESEARRMEAELRAKQEAKIKKLEEQINILQSQGKEDKALEKQMKIEALRETPTIVVPAPKIDGVVVRTIWKYRIIDETKIPREYLMPDEKKIGAVVRASGGSIKIDGIEIYSETSIVSKSE